MNISRGDQRSPTVGRGGASEEAVKLRSPFYEHTREKARKTRDESIKSSWLKLPRSFTFREITREETPRRYLGFYEQRYYDQGVPYNGQILDVHRYRIPRARLIGTEHLARLHFRVSAIEFRVDVYRGIGTRADTRGGNKKRECEGILFASASYYIASPPQPLRAGARSADAMLRGVSHRVRRK